MSEQIDPKTILICYTQATFDNLPPDPESEEENEDEPLAVARRIEQIAHGLTASLKVAGLTAEEVRVPQRSFEPRSVAKAAFGWRLLDLTESNGVKVDMLVCLDFPAWSVAHSNKICWLTYLPNFIRRRRSGPRPTLTIPLGALPASLTPANLIGPSQNQQDTAQTVTTLLQGERRGLSEAKRVLTGSRTIAEEIARSGLQAEYNPFPADLSQPPESEEWQLAVKRLLGHYANS